MNWEPMNFKQYRDDVLKFRDQPVSGKPLTLFGPVKPATKNGEVYTPKTSCIKGRGASVHILL